MFALHFPKFYLFLSNVIISLHVLFISIAQGTDSKPDSKEKTSVSKANQNEIPDASVNVTANSRKDSEISDKDLSSLTGEPQGSAVSPPVAVSTPIPTPSHASSDAIQSESPSKPTTSNHKQELKGSTQAGSFDRIHHSVYHGGESRITRKWWWDLSD